MEFPRFRPDVQVLQRDEDVIQIGLNPSRAVLLRGPDIATVRNIDGSQSVGTIVGKALDRDRAQRVLDLLHARNLLDNRSRPSSQDSIVRIGQLRSELVELDVLVHGGGRLGTTIALLLASEGLSRVRVIDSREVTSSDVTPWGASRVDIGNRRDRVAALLIERMHRGAANLRLHPGRRNAKTLDVVVCDQVADWPWFASRISDDFMASDSRHIAISCASQAAAVTHVIEPGVTACISCYHHSHADLDPQWPNISRQLELRQSIDTANLAHILAVAHACLSRIEEWAVGTNREEIDLIHRDGTRESIPINAHPMCGCMWDRIA